jgi:uncharacterized membrane protein
MASRGGVGADPPPEAAGVAGGGETGPKRVTDDTRARTIAKSLSWRIGGSIMTVGIAWIVTGKIEVAASIGVLDTLLKVLAFYLHERLWLRIPFGRSRPPEYEI